MQSFADWKSSWRELGQAESEPGFRDLIAEMTARGLRTGGVVGAFVVVAYVAIQVAGRGRSLSAVWESGATIVVWDKLLIAAMLGLLVLIGRSTIGRRYGRLIGCSVAIVAAVASFSDDLLNGSTAFSAAWMALIMVATAGILPLRPAQAMTFWITMVAAYVGMAVLFMTETMAPPGTVATGIVYLTSAGLVVVSFSGFLFLSRWREFSARQRIEDLASQLSVKAERLELAEALKSRFFTGITHDIRTPLSLVLGPLTDLLRHSDAVADPEVRRPLQLARRNADRLGVMIDDLLNLAHLDSGQLVLRQEPYDLDQFAERAVLELAPLAERHGVRLDFRGPGAPVVVRFDPDRMAQVLQNLISNAIQNTPVDGRVRVSVESVDGAVARTIVRNSGPGISAEDRDHLFDRFHRGTSKSAHTGFGLGLAIAREYVELHAGRLEADSEPGFGATFRMDLKQNGEKPLPLPEWAVDDDSPYVDQLQNHDPVTAATASAPHVLVVDDNSDMRAYLAMHLAGRYRLSEAADGDDALRIVRAEHPDLVISDVAMPRMSGIELCRAIRSDPELKGIPVVLVTARSDASAHVEALAAGADDYLLKPFDASALIARLENLVELRRLLSGMTGSDQTRIGPTEIDVVSAEEVFVSRVRDVIEEHISDLNFGVDWLADEVGLSPRQLQRRLRDATRLTPAGYIRLLRLGRAAQLLESGATNVSETAYAVGFRDSDHFSKLFRQAYGVPPSRYSSDDVPASD